MVLSYRNRCVCSNDYKRGGFMVRDCVSVLNFDEKYVVFLLSFGNKFVDIVVVSLRYNNDILY